ncbi:MAG: hypothetical protein GTO14_14275 [Anaerolineales bacterium]|nr:hypothetical protein [Anaerolineales bacterium]
MSKDCRNDCVEIFEFPKKIENRPGLPRIRYRIGTYSDFRETMLRALNRDEVLSTWTHRASDDPGIALLEGAAVLGDILTFYQELYANEAYLRTARWRESVSDLVRLLGYRLTPGVGGRATFAFEVKGDRPVIIPPGFPVKAQVEGLEEQAEFETVIEATAYPALSKFSLYRPYTLPNITVGTNSFSVETQILEQGGLTLEEKDRLLLVSNPSDPSTDRQVVVIKQVEERFDRTEIEIEGQLEGSFVGSQVQAYKLGRTFRHFGFNGPTETVEVSGTTATTTDVDFHRRVGTAPGEVVGMVVLAGEYTPLATFTDMPLDQEVDDLAVGSTMLVVLQLSSFSTGGGAEYFFERRVTKATKASISWGAMSGGSTVVRLDQDVSYVDQVFTDIRSIEFLEVIGGSFSLQGAYTEDTTADLSSLLHFGLGEDYQNLKDRQLLLVREDGLFEQLSSTIDETLVSDDPIPRLRPVYLPVFEEDFSLQDFPLLDDPLVVVYANLVEATQGKSEKEAVLGNGDSRQAFQTFKLPKSPLTYHKSAGQTPPEVPELKIYVEGRLWTRVPTFFDHDADEEIYIVREDMNGDSWVQFGDGKTGKRLPSGVKNVIARYRSGIGAYGALKEETKPQAGGKLNNLVKIYLPGVASGGDQPESGDNARQAAPGKVQSLDRLVSLEDYEWETLAISGVSKVRAAWDLVDNVPCVVLTVLMETGRGDEIDDVRQILAEYNRCRGPDRFPILVLQGKLNFVCLKVNVAFDTTFLQEDVTEDIKEALGVKGELGLDASEGLFSLAERRFAQPEYASRIEGVIQAVPGVQWTKVTGLLSMGESETPSELAPPEVVPFSVSLTPASHQVLALYKGHLQINPISGPPVEAC